MSNVINESAEQVSDEDLFTFASMLGLCERKQGQWMFPEESFIQVPVTDMPSFAELERASSVATMKIVNQMEQIWYNIPLSGFLCDILLPK